MQVIMITYGQQMCVPPFMIWKMQSPIQIYPQSVSIPPLNPLTTQTGPADKETIIGHSKAILVNDVLIKEPD